MGYGFDIHLRITSNDPSVADDFHLSKQNYQDLLFST